MSEISPLSRVNGAALGSGTPGTAPVRSAAASASTRPSDRVELSVAAQYLSKLQQLPDIRKDLVARVRSEIASGTYETEDKVDASIDALGEDLQ